MAKAEPTRTHLHLLQRQGQENADQAMRRQRKRCIQDPHRRHYQIQRGLQKDTKRQPDQQNQTARIDQREIIQDQRQLERQVRSRRIRFGLTHKKPRPQQDSIAIPARV